ncbi:hypothetical protein [Nonomuraea sp. NPDC049400]|uniref:hypothetical protein n=1 Tax=Nonomuraea sp. NPDC049400 TaxID=3364352 RepID=UPI0037AFB777
MNRPFPYDFDCPMPDLTGLSETELRRLAHPWPVEWLYEPAPDAPIRMANLFAGPGGWCSGVRDVLGQDVDMVGVELHKDAAATAEAAGFRRIVADVRHLNPRHPALRWVRALLVSAPCGCWTPAGKRAGLMEHNLALLLDVFSMAAEATLGHWHDAFPCDNGADCGICHGDETWDLSGWTGPLLTLEEARSPIAEMTDERVGLIAEVVIWALCLTTAFDNLAWLAMEQSSTLPERVLNGIAEELLCADWCDAKHLTLDAMDYGLASRRKRVFLMAARHRYVQLDALKPRRPIAQTTAAQALGWPSGVRVNTRGARRTSGGNEWSADKPAIAITSKVRGWYWAHDKTRRFSLDEAALLVGFRPGFPWTGSRSSSCQQIGDVVAPLMSCVVVGTMMNHPWEPPLHAYLRTIYPLPAGSAPHPASSAAALRQPLASATHARRHLIRDLRSPMPRRIPPFQIAGNSDSAKPGNYSMVLQFGPRYSPPLDHTMVLTVFHRTNGGGVSVLVDDEQAAALAAWLARGAGEHVITDTQTEARFRREPGAEACVHVEVGWNSGVGRVSITLSASQAAEAARWLTEEALTYQWPGWLSPLAVSPGFHDHLSVDGQRQPCRLCDLAAEAQSQIPPQRRPDSAGKEDEHVTVGER